ncbi:M48 family metalloprotease [Undibacterium sp. Jales W-56]|uniref:M48 family metalloprotease n=1 Tax=Undibacterium sp. Jales W-56 TaxID=2897325 RepID=UPI0021D06363|nr:M48 family metalloprotease [Undibacterium sp. Jales W-56]MCU6434548.1 M48 family metalloprotease [Undibacterium sp. Jales W-56]
MRLAVLTASCFFSASIAPSLTLAQNLPTLGDTERQDLSPLMERKLGEQIMQSVRRDPDYMDDAPVSEYLNRLGNLMLETRPDARGEAMYNFEFFAVRDPVLNAFAFPGGFIGFHSGLILATQSESELASVMGHEIGHVAQRHIARMIGGQKVDSLIPIAAMILAALAAKSSPDAAMALAIGGQGVAIQRQLNFSREAEREADRVGFQILRDAGFDTAGMVSFFGRLQVATRNYNDTAPAYLRSHPLTSERMADIQARMIDQRYKQHVDSLEFSLAKARVRVLQTDTPQGYMDAATFFDTQLKTDQEDGKLAARYGQAFLAYKQKEYGKAQELLDKVVKQVASSAKQKTALKTTSMFASLDIDIKLASRQYDAAVKLAEQTMQQLPLSRGIVYQYVDALLAAQRNEDAARFLRDQVQLYRQEPKLQNQLGKVYELQGKQALQHIALAEAYALNGALPAALQQLDIARRAPDAQYYEQAVIDAKEREWKEKHKEELKDEKNRK